MIFDWPTWLEPQSMELTPLYAQAAGGGVFGSGDQVIEHPGSRWGWNLDFGSADERLSRKREAFISKLGGQQHAVRFWDFLWPEPVGTIARLGVTVRAPVAQWGTVLPLTGCGTLTTLLEGDWVGVGDQLFRVTADTVASGSGAMDVPIAHMARLPIGAGASVRLVQPMAVYKLAETTVRLPRDFGDEQPGFALAFKEHFV